MSFFRVASVSLLVFGSACALPEEDTNAVEQHLPFPGGAGCDEWGCGGNSPYIDHLGVHDLQGLIDGSKNANGFQVKKIQWRNPSCPGCAPVTLKQVWAEKAQLFASDGGAFVYGAVGKPSVQGLSITVEDGGGNRYEIIVKDIARVQYWAHVTGGEVGLSYDLEWDVEATAPGQKRNWTPVCSNPPAQGSPEAMGMEPLHSIVFENDEIDALAKTVTLRKEKFWFNIGCAGHALAKLHLTGHTSGANAAYPGFHTGTIENQTMLKAITADYCGTGFPFTVAGQPLQWRDAPGFNQYLPGFGGKKEAEWTDAGARCLNTPRVIANHTALGDATFPTATLADMQAYIASECKIPVCADMDPYNLNGSHVITSNP